MMRILFLFFTLFSLIYSNESIQPSQFTVELVKACEVMILSEKPQRKAKKIVTHLSTGSCVQNLGCLREVTQKELDAMNEIKRAHMSWKYPVWCKVDADGKRGWIRKQFLSEAPCKDSDDK